MVYCLLIRFRVVFLTDLLTLVDFLVANLTAGFLATAFLTVLVDGPVFSG